MTPPNNSAAALTALQAQIDGLGDRMKEGFDEVKGMIMGFDTRVRGLETREAGCQPVLAAGLKSAQDKIDEHDKQLKALEMQMSRLMTAYGVLVLIGSSTMLSVMALIWALITGQAEVIFK
jgi:predicted phage tail protein